MLVDVLHVEVVAPGRLRLRFDDGFAGEVNVRDLVPYEGVFARLAEPEYFALVRVDSELGTVVWPNGADLDPAVLREAAR